MNHFVMLAFALVIENFVGYPQSLQRAIGHPVEWIGKLIAYLDEGLNDPDSEPSDQRNHGIFMIAALCVAVGVPAFLL